jgi:hypothetical protein
MIGSMFRKAWYSDSATLSLDFTTGVLDSRLTFTRSSTATYIDSSGYVASAGIDSPRFDHDPTTLAPRGLLIEGQTANAVTYSDCRTTGWSGLNATGTNDSATAPDNTTTATLWTGGSGGGNRAYSQTFSVTSGNTYTASVYVKKPTSNAARYAKIYIRNSVEGVIGWPSNGVLDLDTGVISGTGYTVTPYSNGWYRIVSVGTVTSTTNARVFIAITDSSGTETPTPTVTTALLWWGAQLETGSGASSYIPTGASTATRDRDQVTLTNLSSINFSQTEGTCLATVEVREKADSTFLPYGSFDTSGGGRCWWWLRHNLSTVAGTRLLGTAFNSGGSGVLNTSNYVYNGGSGGVVKFATSLDTAASSMVFVIAGGAPQTTTAAAFTLATAAQWGLNTSTDTVATALGSMWVQSFKYWPTKLSNAQLQSLTL